MTHRHARSRVPVRTRVSDRIRAVADRIVAIARRRPVLSGLLALALVPVLLGVHVVSAAFTAATANAGNTWQATNISAASGLTSTRVNAAGGMVQLSWTASPTSFTSGYAIERATASGGPFTQVANMAAGTTGVTEFSSGMSAG